MSAEIGIRRSVFNSFQCQFSGAEIELIGIEDKEYILQKKISKIRDQFDFIIIDCPPSLNMLTINAMTTANTVLVPIQCEYYALEGLSQLMHTIELVQERLNRIWKWKVLYLLCMMRELIFLYR